MTSRTLLFATVGVAVGIVLTISAGFVLVQGVEDGEIGALLGDE